MLYIIAGKRKYFCVNLNKYVQDVHVEKFKMLMKEIKNDPNKWMFISLPCTEDSVKILIVPNGYTDLTEFLSKFL